MQDSASRSAVDVLVLGGEVLHEPVLPLAEVWHGHVETASRDQGADLTRDTTSTRRANTARGKRTKQKQRKQRCFEALLAGGSVGTGAWETKPTTKRRKICSACAYVVQPMCTGKRASPMKDRLQHLLRLVGEAKDVVHYHDGLRPRAWRGRMGRTAWQRGDKDVLRQRW